MESISKECNYSPQEYATLTPVDVAEILCIPTHAVKELLESGELPGYLYGNHWRIKESELNRFIMHSKNIECKDISEEPKVTQTSEPTVQNVEYIDTEDVADILKISVQTVRRMLNNKDLIGYKYGRVWRIDAKEFEKFMRSKKNVG